MDAKPVIRYLTTGQRSCIRGLDDEPAELGCSEPYARRLAVGNSRRPALVAIAVGGVWDKFSLTAEGQTVKAVLLELEGSTDGN